MRVPMATGMTLALDLQAVRSSNPGKPQYFVMSRIDQKSVLKCAQMANCVPIIIPLVADAGGSLRTDLVELQQVAILTPSSSRPSL